MLFLAYHTNSTAATGSGGLHDIHVLVVAHFSLVAPSLVVLWEQISGWAYFKILSVSTSLPLHVTPQVTFVANVPSSRKMIYLLELVHIPQLPRTNESSPQAVPGATISKSEASELKGVDHTIISMCRIVDSEG